ncbi:unnamed protein product [Enterobius vermicularis]|uniref:N(4)-(Beta-N-acetylglucosaminyl)-L-asparaginase n=1 Tax=Enterobius vermicularis TaxID=51028 RepID=A0A0N4VGV3_ENTVE|nr:unnamed protein product [Enterobius vermicularis]
MSEIFDIFRSYHFYIVAWKELSNTHNRLHSLVEGLSLCETLRCDGSVGYGGSPDEDGETRLDALVFDGPRHRMGAVASLGGIKEAAKVAYAVMKYTKHSMLAGDAATNFALGMGFKRTSLYSNESRAAHQKWLTKNCQPNFRKNVLPDPRLHCGPYKPMKRTYQEHNKKTSFDTWTGDGHDTMGIVIVDDNGDISVGTTTNGATHKIPGYKQLLYEDEKNNICSWFRRVGDSPIPGAGGYVDNDYGGAVATGDGDEMMRFLPRQVYQTVENMRQGFSPQKAAKLSIDRIRRFHPNFFGGIVAVNKTGHYGAACNGMKQFSYSVQNSALSVAKVLWINCPQ